MRIRFLVFPVLFFVSVCGATTAAAQSPAPRFEIGIQATMLRFSDFDRTNTGIGGRVTFELTPWAALEAEGNVTPDDDILIPNAPAFADIQVAYRRRRADAFFGMKIGHRLEKLGVFAKVRPGFVRQTDRGIECVGTDCARILMLFLQPEYRTEFAMDMGGGVEFYPSRRTVARVEVGDTMIRQRSTAPPCPASTCTSHNITTRVGVGFRF